MKPALIALLCVLNISLSFADDSPKDLPEVVVRYLAYYDSVRSFQADTVTQVVQVSDIENIDSFSMSSTNTTFNSGRCTIDFRNNTERLDYYADQDIKRIDIYRNGYRMRYNPDMLQGGIMKEKRNWDVTTPWGMGYVGGYILGNRTAESLSDILTKNKFAAITDATKDHFVISKAYHNPNSQVFCNIEVTVSPKHDYCPTKIRYVDINPADTSQTMERFVVYAGQFEKVQGIWIPTAVATRMDVEDKPHCSITIASNILLNKPIDTLMQFEFPPEASYYDERDGSRHGPLFSDPNSPGNRMFPPEESCDKEQIAAPWQANYISGPIQYLVIGASVIVLGGLVRRKFFAFLIILAPMLSVSTGCNESQGLNAQSSFTPSPAPATQLQAATGLTPVSAMPIKIPFGREEASYEKQATAKFKNSTNQTIVLDEEISTTCGCTQAQWSATKVKPGEEVEMKLTVSRPNANSKKVIQSKGKFRSEAAQTIEEVEAIIQVDYDTDWSLRDSQLVFRGIAGTSPVATLRVECKKGMELKPTISGPAGIEIKGVRTVDLKMGLYDIEAALTTPIASDKPLGEVTVRNPGASPESLSIVATAEVAPPATWDSRVLDLAKNREVKLAVASGWNVTRWEMSPDSIPVTKLEDQGTPTFVFPDETPSFGRGSLKVFLSNQEHEVACDLLVFSFPKE